MRMDPPHHLLDITHCCNNQQPVFDYYQICLEDSKKIMLESNSVNNTSLGTDPHITHESCSLQNICFERNDDKRKNLKS